MSGGQNSIISGRERERKPAFNDLQMLRYEEELYKKGIRLVAGVDEAGRGPLSGPVVAGAVIFSPGARIDGVRDSKLLSPKKREELFNKICKVAEAVGIGIVSEAIIDRVNILQATYLAMRRAIDSLSVRPEYLLVDGRGLPGTNIPQLAIIGGDRLSRSVASGSIIAKVTRDRIVTRQGKLFPQYGFAVHKGYPTRKHLEALRKYGPCRVHRRSFKPVKSLCKRHYEKVPS